jgi:hypothetical protein
MILGRRRFLRFVAAAPAIVTAANLMPVKVPKHGNPSLDGWVHDAFLQPNMILADIVWREPASPAQVIGFSVVDWQPLYALADRQA